MVSLTLTPDEAQALINSLDATVRAQGLSAAGVCLNLAVKIQAALQMQGAPVPAASGQDAPKTGRAAKGAAKGEQTPDNAPARRGRRPGRPSNAEKAAAGNGTGS